MLKDKGKITIRQVFIMFSVIILSPTIRLFPNLCARAAGGAGWVSPLFSLIPLLLLCYVMNSIFKNNNVQNLSHAFELSCGKIIGKAISTIYLLWFFILFFLYTKYYADRLLASVFPTADVRFFIVIMMLIVFMTLRKRIEAFARFCELIYLMFALIFIIFYLMLLPNVRVANIYPVTHLDIIPVIQGCYPVLGIWGYIAFLFFFGDTIKNKNQIKMYMFKRTILFSAMTSFTLIFIIGTFGAGATVRMNLPFFSAIKTIAFMEPLDRFQSILLSIWVVSDFAIITTFAFLILNTLKNIFAISEIKYFSSPFVMFGFIGSMFFTSSRFELEDFSTKIGLHVNVILCFIVPLIILIIGKLRKKI